MHLLRTERGGHAFVVEGSQVFDLDEDSYARINAALGGGGDLPAILMDLGLGAARPRIGDEAPARMPVRALSLAVAQKCNLGCTYCYASEGDFGSTPTNMALDTALAAADLLFAETPPGERIHLAFLGGEPLANRGVLRRTTEHARRRAVAEGRRIGFAITTNGTLLTPEDADFFEKYGFAVTVSLDGPREDHDRQRPFKGGRGSFDAIVARVVPLLARAHAMQVTARVTVTPANLRLRKTLEQLLDLGFTSVGFSPMLASPTGRGEMRPEDLAAMLNAMIDCGLEFERRALRGEPYGFDNLATALREIHRGTHRPYPCGAGAGYMAVSAEGGLAACHRFVGDPAGAMGALGSGIDTGRQADWLASRHVHKQAPCRTCWARYLCGGGCHHEVLMRGRSSCDYVRGWLHYSLQAYLRMIEAMPYAFGNVGDAHLAG